MADQTITITAVTPANPKVDVSEVTRQDGTVAERQRMTIGDNTDPSAFAYVDQAKQLTVNSQAMQSMLLTQRLMLVELRKLNLALQSLSLDDINPGDQLDISDILQDQPT